MPCFFPLRAYRSRTASQDTGKRSISFKASLVHEDAVSLPCGQCVGCRLERSRQWAVRCLHEASLHEDNCFLTLTLSASGIVDRFGKEEFSECDRVSVRVRDLQLFMKRLRAKVGRRVRFYACGEYGEKFSRPHYHVLLFGYDFSDRVFHTRSGDGSRLFKSESLEKLWPFGHCLVGDVTFQSAAYVARYVMKKVTGQAAEDHYGFFDSVTGEISSRGKEFVVMSRRPGIGKPWFDKYVSDVFPRGFVIVNGVKVRPPRAYVNYLENIDPFIWEEFKELAELSASTSPDNTKERLYVRRRVLEARLSMLPRGLNDEE